MKSEIVKFEKKLKKYLDKERFVHTQGVMYTAAALAMAHGADMEKARLAGLLHDCAKCIPNKKKWKLCDKYHILLSECEQQNPFLIHAKLGVAIAREKYEIQDEEILSAIRWHTTGKDNMTDLEKIADYIEPQRDKAPNLEWIRKVSFMDLNEGMYYILKDSLSYLGRSGRTIDPATEKAFHYYETMHLAKRGKEKNNHE